MRAISALETGASPSPKWLELNCIVGGEITSFPVKILSSKIVGLLKNAIYPKITTSPSTKPKDISLSLVPGGVKEEELENLPEKSLVLLGEEREKLHTYFPDGAANGCIHIIVNVPQPRIIRAMLESNDFKPKPRTDFSTLLKVEAGDQITAMNLGQTPKSFGEGYQGHEFFVTEQMMDLWKELTSKSRRPKQKCISGPTGVEKSHIAWFLAAKAYAHGWPVLYIADAEAPSNTETSEQASTAICQRFWPSIKTF
ncbi:hypothetical protein BX616_001585 [Lobosporangium transversale]|nr:hypothetical protein BX616_001585 [Lobosporangium transversale]